MQKKYKVLITGSSGMLGIDLCQELGKDFELCGVDIADRAGLTGKRPIRQACFYECNISYKHGIARIVRETMCDIVIHTAAWTNVDGCELDRKKAFAINSAGAKNVAYACKISDVPLIYISTDFVFDGKKKRPYKETDSTHPLSVYGESKLAGEDAVRKVLKKHFIVRTSWLYGRHGKNFVDTIIEKAGTVDCLRVVEDQVGSPTYTKDLAKAIHLLLDKAFETQVVSRKSQDTRAQVKGYGIYHVSNSGATSWYRYTKEILRVAASRTKVIPISSKELSRPAKRPAMSVMDNSKFERFTGCSMPNWKNALKRYLLKDR
ncbi:MAG: dTDP-4-dehydrorhamnose reductase [Candidatus Omnitrophota bacterium]|jgi:dTDP-4-dehydrorhamnose reductase